MNCLSEKEKQECKDKIDKIIIEPDNLLERLLECKSHEDELRLINMIMRSIVAMDKSTLKDFAKNFFVSYKFTLTKRTKTEQRIKESLGGEGL